MKNHDFKVGDAVKLREQYKKMWPFLWGHISIICEIQNEHIIGKLPRGVQGCGDERLFPFLPEEIEHTVRKGQQLMLFNIN